MSFSFIIPADFVAQHALGQVVRHGAILKDVASGQIVAHLQETGRLVEAVAQSPLASMFTNPLASAVGATSSLVGNYQNYRIEQRIGELSQLMHGLQSLQFASLALAGLGLGVSVAGFLAVRDQVNKVSVKLDGMAQTIDRHFAEQRRREFRNLEGDLEAQLEHAEEGWAGGGTARWTRVADRLQDMVNRYPALIEEVVQAPTLNPAMLCYFLERYRVLAATRIECLVLVGEWRPARDFASRFSQKTNDLLSGVTPTEIAAKIERDRGAGKSGIFGSDIRREAGNLVAAMREFQDISETRPLLLDMLMKRGAEGREYVESLRDNQASPVLLLK